jgi:hypothetical protein
MDYYPRTCCCSTALLSALLSSLLFSLLYSVIVVIAPVVVVLLLVCAEILCLGQQRQRLARLEAVRGQECLRPRAAAHAAVVAQRLHA